MRKNFYSFGHKVQGYEASYDFGHFLNWLPEYICRNKFAFRNPEIAEWWEPIQGHRTGCELSTGMEKEYIGFIFLIYYFAYIGECIFLIEKGIPHVSPLVIV